MEVRPTQLPEESKKQKLDAADANNNVEPNKMALPLCVTKVRGADTTGTLPTTIADKSDARLAAKEIKTSKMDHQPEMPMR